ncbi:MAG: hypothetical protein KDD66_00470, partial [Bdellovibrionales bacterium]|nr:hypothetical protein [Bdellovibrionales bacterium]
LPAGSHVHVSAVCGTGTGSVAKLLKDLGFKVTGSDKAFYPPMGDVVRGFLDKVYEGYSESNLSERPDLVVIGNNLSRGNPEVEFVLREGIPYASMPEVFGALLAGSREDCPTSIIAAGTHGKTTTSAMIATMLEVSGRKPGYFVGGVPTTLPGSVRAVDKSIAPEKRCVVFEGDEYDSAFFAKWPKFHSYRPDIVVFTSLEFDHADIYECEDDIALEFTRLMQRVPKSGAVLLCDTYESLEDLGVGWDDHGILDASLYWYGAEKKSDFRILKREQVQSGSEQRQKLKLKLRNGELEILTTETGEHNAQNMLAAAAVGELVGLTPKEIKHGLEAYRGVLRRQVVVLESGGITVIEDFAHHPTAVKLTLEGLRERYPDSRLIAVYEPRSNTSRRAFFQDAYGQAFSAADVILIKKVEDAGGYSGTSTEIVALDSNKLIAAYQAAGKSAFTGTVSEMLGHLEKLIQPKDVVVVMSNGDFEGLLPKLLKLVKEK